MSLFPCLITGAAGFIGSHLWRVLSAQGEVWAVDNLSHAAHPLIVDSFSAAAQRRFFRADVSDWAAMKSILAQAQPNVIFHLAAQTHVDRSIDAPESCVLDNVYAMYGFLQVVRDYFEGLPEKRRQCFRLVYVSTDEVYGSLALDEAFHSECAPIRAGNPYAASKAAAEQLALSWMNTYGVPVVISRCSNNYGIWQHAEKLIVRSVLCALLGLPIEVYGKGNQVRDWLAVGDHVRALVCLAKGARVGEVYNVSANNPLDNLSLVREICFCLQRLCGQSHYVDLIDFVADRPGHDFRYGVDSRKIRAECGWLPECDFKLGLFDTVKWYVDNREAWLAVCGEDLRRRGLAVKKG